MNREINKYKYVMFIVLLIFCSSCSVEHNFLNQKFKSAVGSINIDNNDENRSLKQSVINDISQLNTLDNSSDFFSGFNEYQVIIKYAKLEDDKYNLKLINMNDGEKKINAFNNISNPAAICLVDNSNQIFECEDFKQDEYVSLFIKELVK
ncbi:hypothetical protein [Mycoplasma sp. P36-A1]|uniref:hypothetical protein n=1 Tax=Mycoplasma sp. P36-A1 TaxID=3252900 RepID=UPI003C2BC98B